MACAKICGWKKVFARTNNPIIRKIALGLGGTVINEGKSSDHLTGGGFWLIELKIADLEPPTWAFFNALTKQKQPRPAL